MLHKVTNNFRSPAVIRGLVKDTPGYRLWPQDGYLAQQCGENDVYVMKNNTNQSLRCGIKEREFESASTALTRIMSDPHSIESTIFPPMATYKTLTSVSLAFKKQINDLVLKDFELDKRIWVEFRNKIQWRVLGAQVAVSKGDDKGSSGLNWHLEPGTNFYVMAHGKKRWHFVEPKYDPYMYPVRGTDFNMIASQYDMADHERYIPRLYADLIAGDVLVVPQNTEEGLMISLPIRVINVVSVLRNNPHYLSIFLINASFKAVVGVELGGYFVGDY